MWWLVNVALVGIVGAAKVILDALRREAARERKAWEDEAKKIDDLVQKQSREIERVQRQSLKAADIARLTALHQESHQLGDRAYRSLEGARKTLDAMGKAIVETAQARKTIEERKRNASGPQRIELEQEIRSLHKLRDEILTPDKDKVKAERDRILANVRTLNAQTARLRDTLNQLRGPRRR
jgi:hypothetical protein